MWPWIYSRPTAQWSAAVAIKCWWSLAAPCSKLRVPIIALHFRGSNPLAAPDRSPLSRTSDSSSLPRCRSAPRRRTNFGRAGVPATQPQNTSVQHRVEGRRVVSRRLPVRAPGGDAPTNTSRRRWQDSHRLDQRTSSRHSCAHSDAALGSALSTSADRRAAPPSHTSPGTASSARERVTQQRHLCGTSFRDSYAQVERAGRHRPAASRHDRAPAARRRRRIARRPRGPRARSRRPMSPEAAASRPPYPVASAGAA